MEDKKKFVNKISNARKEIALELEKALEEDKNLKLYPRKLEGKDIDVTIKDGEILTIANINFKELFNEVDFDRVYAAKDDKYKEGFKRMYNNCHEAIRSNGNMSLNITVVGVIGPLFNPEQASNGYNVYRELNFSIEELLHTNPEYFYSLKAYGGKYISIDELANFIFNIEDGSGNLDSGEEVADGVGGEEGGMGHLTYSRNKILFGPPGAGKSHSIKAKLNLINVKEENTTRITFHPEYSYYEFVGQYRPVVAYERVAGDNIRYPNSPGATNEKAFVYYDFVPGPFTKAIIKALKLSQADSDQSSENALLIIEEINRGNSSAIFGDIFQLLDRINDVSKEDYGESEYPIDIAIEMKEYIKERLAWDEDAWKAKFPRGFIIPSNLYIYATMNTSDQSLYPMDSAFKRRWDMEYIYINYKEDKLSDLYLPYPYNKIKWLDFIKMINKEIVAYTGVDDKQIGQWFVGHSLSDTEFLGKVISYLWFDIFRHDPGLVFKSGIDTFDELRSSYKNGVFREEIIESIKNTEADSEVDENEGD